MVPCCCYNATGIGTHRHIQSDGAPPVRGFDFCRGSGGDTVHHGLPGTQLRPAALQVKIKKKSNGLNSSFESLHSRGFGQKSHPTVGLERGTLLIMRIEGVDGLSSIIFVYMSYLLRCRSWRLVARIQVNTPIPQAWLSR